MQKILAIAEEIRMLSAPRPKTTICTILMVRVLRPVMMLAMAYWTVLPVPRRIWRKTPETVRARMLR